ncbi:hypothetical protein B0I35DRAFT_1044 [Stachybotrys elegans]|uniref:AAA+ ATPase domain-containing protein n=1 Tax=Stachybotrys elegans TaxID=80388 RepID=A0A8K0WVM9_9HYPO|nr:hypothetical protein B0I35DRAFT_1044 [Stachybotrys elegans]
MSDFPSLSLVLMAGACWNVPELENGPALHPGDAVISTSILQVDSNKLYHSEVFKIKNTKIASQNTPHAHVLKIAGDLKTIDGRLAIQSRTIAHLDTIHRQKVIRPRPGEKSDESWEQYTTPDALRPGIFFGALTSGILGVHPRVAAKALDVFNATANEPIIALEKEGASLWDEAPCLAIRGVCSTSASPTQKRYAAATAASVIRAVIDSCPVQALATNRFTATEMRQAPRHIPFPQNDNFVVREDLMAQLDGLLGAGQAAALWGPEGCGKTQLALNYTYGRKPACSVFWADGHNKHTFAQSFKAIASSLNCEITGLSIPEMLREVCSCIQKEQEWLLVIDDADDPELFDSGTASFRQFIPTGRSGTVIWTSHDLEIVKDILGAERCLEVGQMSYDQARQLLSRAINPDELQGFRWLLEELGGVSLTIQLVGISVRETSMTIPSLRRWLQYGRLREAGDRSNVSDTLSALVLVVIEQLARSGDVVSKTASKVLHIMAHFDSQPIPWECLEMAAGYASREDDMFSIHPGRGDALLAVCKLVDMALLSEWWTHEGEQRYEMPICFQKYARLRLANAAQSATSQKQHGDVYFSRGALKTIHDLFPKDPDVTPEKFSNQCERYAGQALHIIQLYGDICDRPYQLAKLARRVVAFLWVSGRYEDVVVLERHVISLLRKKVGAFHRMTIYFQLLLAEAYSCLGQYEEATTQALRVLWYQKRVMGEASEPIIATRYILAHAGEKMNWLSEAEVEASRALYLGEKVLGRIHPTSLHILGKLGIILRRQKRYFEAERVLSEALNRHRKRFGETYSESIIHLKPLSNGFSETRYPPIVERIFRLTTHSRQVFMNRPDFSPGSQCISQKSPALALDSVEQSSLRLCLANSLLKDSTTYSLYLRVLERFGLEKFPGIHNRILAEYLIDLQDATTSALELRAIASANGPKSRQDTTRTMLLLMALREQSILTSLGMDPSMQLTTTLFPGEKASRKLKARLMYLLEEPSDMTAALSSRSVDVLSLFIEYRLAEAITGKYQWIEGLIQMDYTYDEVAELLYQAVHDSPWIYFEPDQSILSDTHKTETGFHLEGCAHSLLPEEEDLEPISGPGTDLKPTEEDESVTLRFIEELCGLGGVVPISRNKADWEGKIIYHENDHSQAMISYPANPTVDASLDVIVDMFDRIGGIAGRLLAAGGYYQKAGYCCNSFTILALDHSIGAATNEQIELIRIEFSMLEKIRDHCLTIGDLARPSRLSASGLRWVELTCALGKLLAISDSILRRVIYKDAARERLSEDAYIIFKSVSLPKVTSISKSHIMDILGLACLALQTLCLGFLFYTRVHAAGVRPFFIDRTIREFKLLGLDRQMLRPNSPFSGLAITAKEYRLSCLDEMTRGPVMAFCLGGDQGESAVGRRFDVMSNIHDILDTWGPGALLYSPGPSPEPVGLMIGGGFICPYSSGQENMYHWSRGAMIPPCAPPLDAKSVIVVGALVQQNLSCANQNNEGACWKACSNSMTEVGTFKDFWEPSERQVGLQFGSDPVAFVVQVIMAKQRGRTAKARPRQYIEQHLICFLDRFWGVRVSYCTGIAQRVLLRQLIGDLFPVFAQLHRSKSDQQAWYTLREDPHNIVHRLTQRYDQSNHVSGGEAIASWLGGLEKELSDFAYRVIAQIIDTLRDTGMSPDGSFFHVAWPYYPTVTHGFRVPVKEGGSKWLLVLEDSDSCITFAYMTKDCLEAGEIKCRGQHATWSHEMPLIETAVICPAVPQQWTLQPQETYFFLKLNNSLVHFRAEQCTLSHGQVGMVLVRIRSLDLGAFQGIISNRIRVDQKNKRLIRERLLYSQQAEFVSILSKRINGP